MKQDENVTKYPEIFAALAAPFDCKEEKVRTGTGAKFTYITARTAMNRMDNVLGPENWWDEFTAHENSVLCRLTIRLPDGTTLTKSDAGGYAGMSDQGDDDKSGYSDAFKRAAAKFGVARYLYRDGIPNYSGETVTPSRPASPTAAPARAPQAPARSYDNFRIPKPGKQVYAWARSQEDHFKTTIRDGMKQEGERLGKGTNFVDWDEETVNAVAGSAIAFIKTLDNYQGEYDAVELPKAASAAAAAEGGHNLPLFRKQIEIVARVVFKTIHGREPIGTEVDALVADVGVDCENGRGEKGEYMDSLAKCTDGEWLANIHRGFTRYLKSLNGKPVASQDNDDNF